MDWNKISAIISAIVTVGGGTWRAIVVARKKLSDIIAKDTAFLAQQIHEIKQEQKFIGEQINSLKHSLNEIKGLEINNRADFKNFEREIKFSLDKNIEILNELKKSKAEWLSENLLRVSENKKSGG